MWFEVRLPLSPAERATLESELLAFGNLQGVLRWAFGLQPPRDVTEVVVQDEYSHDVVLQRRDAVWLAFDTT